ncbi:MAG: hypothetical protein QOC62_5937 [Mycobacterium sp.]|jgi:hypothetical protein|nr:hypothetical protein [Mycobacterium sp.]
MSRIGTRIVTIAAAAGGLGTAFLALSPIAAADSAPILPALPGINVVQQLANAPAMASQLLQNAATMLQPALAAPAASATPPASAPTATASLNLPQPPLSAPMNNAVGTVPAGPMNLPTSAIPLLSQLGLPGNLSSLPLANLGGAPGAVPAAPAMAGEPALPSSLNPFSALP